MEKKIATFIKRHKLLTKNATVLIGVSGGPDSMALLHYYLMLRDTWNLRLIAVSVDHQLRGAESQADIAYVRQICSTWDIPFSEASLDVKTYQNKMQVGTQVAAREVRYQFFKEQMNYFEADYLALGHHGDDQVETMLMGFVRSASPVAVSGIPVKRQFASGFIVRPLLCVTKQEINAYCEQNQIIPRIDPSNEDTGYTRNFFRKKIIPIIKEKNNNIHTTMQQLSESLQVDEAFLQAEAEKMENTVVKYSKNSKQASFKINMFKLYPLSLQRRVYHLILKYLYNKLPGNLTYVHEEIFFKFLEDTQGNAQIDFPDHLKIEKSYENIIFSFIEQHVVQEDFKAVLHVPGKIDLPDGSVITASHTHSLNGQDEHIWLCDVKEVALPLHIRTRQPGDRMDWKGLDGSKKIKDIFIDSKIPRKERDTWPILTDNNGIILWLIGLRKSNHTKLTKKSIYIQLEYRKRKG